MIETIENILRKLLSAFQTARLYAIDHPRAKESTQQAYKSICEIVGEKGEFVLGLVGDELAYEKEIFFDLSRRMLALISALKAKGIERLSFSRGLELDEFTQLLSFLCLDEKEPAIKASEYLSMKGVRNIVVGRITTQDGEAVQVSSKQSGQINCYEGMIGKVVQNFDLVFNEQQMESLELRFMMLQVMETLLGNYQQFLKLATVKQYDAKTYIHLLNVSILSMNFAQFLGYKKEDCLDIGIAGLFHDIGKLYISRTILKKKESLTIQELETVRSHAMLGAQILIQHMPSLGNLAAVVAFEHHLHYDGTGYPKLAFDQKPHTVSQIVSICDTYDALLQRRTYKRDYPPRMIFDIMMNEKGVRFESYFVDSFFRSTGVWPTGTLVELSDGRIAVVRQANPDAIFSPKIEILSPASHDALDLQGSTLTIRHSLNPFAEGEKYLPLI